MKIPNKEQLLNLKQKTAPHFSALRAACYSRAQQLHARWKACSFSEKLQIITLVLVVFCLVQSNAAYNAAERAEQNADYAYDAASRAAQNADNANDAASRAADNADDAKDAAEGAKDEAEDAARALRYRY